MYIISKYKDYYDGAVGMGIDKTIKYVRDSKEFKEVPEDVLEIIGEESYGWSNYKHLRIKEFYCKKKNRKLFSFFVGFCGKLYIGFKHIDISEDEIIEVIYDLDRVRELIDFKDGSKYRWKRGKKRNKRAEFENYVSDILAIDSFEIFSKYNTPAFTAGYGKFTINPILKNVEFVKAVDPYTAFQEIQMFISGVLGTGSDGSDIVMTEKQKVQQHGFDVKYGFRKRPKG